MKILAMSICRWTEKEKSGSGATAAAAASSASSWGSLWGGDTTGAAAATPEPVIMSQAFEVSEFNMFQRGSVRQFLTAFTRIFVKRTAPGKRNAIEHEGYVVHVQMRQNGLAGCVITDQEYPARVAFSLISDMLAKFWEAQSGSWTTIAENSLSFAPLNQAIAEYQDPQKADKICKIQKELDDTMEVMHQTIDKVLERGVKLDQLVDRSNDLSSQSKQFYKTARDHNRCCIVM